MTALLLSSTALTMSSREIAELCEKQHKDVMRDIRVMLDDLGETLAQFCADLPDAYGRLQPVYTLPKDLTLTLVSGYNVKLRKRVIDRLFELERQAATTPSDPYGGFQVPKSYKEALLLAADQQEQIETLEAEKAAMKPDVEAFSRLAKADGSFCVTDAAKALNMQPKRLFDYLKLNRWIYKRMGGKHWLGYQDKVQNGFLAHVTSTVTLADGTDRLKEQVVVTPKGLARLARDLNTMEVACLPFAQEPERRVSH